MNTIVELYDKEPLENVLSACIFQPEMVVYVCDVKDNTLRKERAVYRFFRSRGIRAKARFYYIDTTDLGLILKLLHAIRKDYPDCVFDCTGGKDLVLLAAGIFCMENRVPAYYMDIASRRFINLFGCESLQKQFSVPDLSAENIFALTGAKLVGSGHFKGETLDSEFEDDVLAVWNEILRDQNGWHRTAGFLQAAGARHPEQELGIHAKTEIRVNTQLTASADENFLRRLEHIGVIRDLRFDGQRVEFFHKSTLMRRCLQNHGIWLELFAYVSAKRSGLFSDVRTSVLVDWDGSEYNNKGTRNEVDVLAVHNVTPVFISCKMGVPTPLALSEIKMLSDKFGGERTQTVLLTAADVEKKNPAVAQRARDLGIYLLDARKMDSGALAKRLRIIAEK